MLFLIENWAANGLIFLIALLTLLYFFLHRKYSYWERKGFITLAGYNYIFGHFKETLLLREFVGEFVMRLYNSTKEPFVGIYSILRPVLMVRDPELIRSILIKDFSNFTDRDVHCNESYDPLSGHLFALPGQRWKNLRSKLSPAFSSGKLKAMFQTLLDCGLTLQNHLNQFANQEKLLNVRDVAARYTTNVVASVGFGIDIDTITDPNNEFRVYGAQIFEPSIENAIRWFCIIIAPPLMSIFRLKMCNSKVEKFLRSVSAQNLEHREKHGISRKDIFQLMVQIRNTGNVQSDDQWETEIKTDENQKSLTENEVAALTFGFFAAGFETSSTTLSFCLYELAKNPDIQQRVHNEIDEAFLKHNGQITYESLADMTYLDRCFDEALRKYPIVPILNRTCVKEYQIPGSDRIIEKGAQIFIPVMALHRDPKYYENPEKFDPERFTEENSAGKNIVNRPYLPFGEGPRNCIAARMGKLQTKFGLVMMLQKFRFELSEEHKKSDIKCDPKSFVTAARGGIHLRVFTR